MTDSLLACLECGATVAKKRPWKKFCGTKCQMRYYQKNQRRMLKSALLKLRVLELETISDKPAAPPKRDLFS